MAVTDTQRDAMAYIQSVLSQYGLGSDADWAWQQIVAGVSPTQLLQDLRQRTSYKDRFSGMDIRRQRGLSAISEGDYISLERGYREAMRSANMPSQFWDSPSDFAAHIGNDRSVLEIQDLIQNAYLAVTQAPPEVRATFADYFGPSGDAAFAAYILDPDKAESVLVRQAQTAVVGGTARQYGFQVGQGLAENIVARGLGPQARQGFAQVAAEAPLYQETISEAQDLTSDTGIQSTFGLDQQAVRDVQRRRDTREAAFGGTGSSLVTQQGAIGLGTAGQ